jgi:hypothetical protein
MRTAITFAALLVTASGAAAQPLPGPSVELHIGYAAFVDDSPVEHFVLGGSARIHLTPRLSVGPEVTYMRGPGDDRDLFLTGNLTFDFLPPRAGGPARRAVPYLVVGGGMMRHSNRFGSEEFTSSEGAFTGGMGVRFNVADRLYVAPEVRLGWELHTRLSVAVGWRLRED